MRPATLSIIGTALGAAPGHAFRAPFPGMGGGDDGSSLRGPADRDPAAVEL